MLKRFYYDEKSKEFSRVIEQMRRTPKITIDAFMHLLHESIYPPKDYKTAEYRISKFFKQHRRDFVLPIPDARTYPVEQLFRIRKDIGDISDPTDIRAWGAPPSSSLGRFNLKGERVLYVGSSEELCRYEMTVEKNTPYYLAQYCVLNQAFEENAVWLQADKLGLNSLFFYPSEFFVGNFPDLIQRLANFVACSSANQYYTNLLYKFLHTENKNGWKTHGLIYTSQYYPMIIAGDLRGLAIVMNENYNIALNHYGIARLGLVSVKLRQNDITLNEYKFDNTSVARPMDT